MKKNIFKLLGIIAIVAAIGFSMAGCGDKGGDGGTSFPSTNSSLTITTIDSQYNNKYVALSSTTGDYLAAASGTYYGNDSDVTVTGGKITNGSVTLKVWKFDSNGDLIGFSGSESVAFEVYVKDTATFTEGDLGSKIGDTVNITITSGNTTKTYAELGIH